MYQLGPYAPEKNFTLLGMAGVMAGVMHAPLTGIFLIAELTGGYQLFMIGTTGKTAPPPYRQINPYPDEA